MADRVTYGPFTLYESDAYKAAKEAESAKKLIDLEKAQLDLAEKRRQQEMESASGRVAMAGDIAATLEQMRQKEEGIQIGPEMAKRTIEKGGPSLLAATQMQGELDVESRIKQAKREALTSFLTGEKSLVPTAKVDVGGITQTVPSGMAATSRADLQSRAYAASWPKLSELYQDQGYSKEDADRLAKENASGELIKGSNSGKISLTLGDVVNPTVVSVPWEKALKMYSDPSTPRSVKDQLSSVFGKPEIPPASSWVKTRLGR